MDNMAYLQQIATPSGQPPKSPLSSLMNGKMIKILIALAILAILIIIIGTITSSGGGNSERSQVEQIQLRSSNLIKTINTYNKSLKSSSLRSTGQSLSTVLTETNRELSSLLKSDYAVSDESDTSLSSETKSSEEDYINKVNTTLENARLNANLDRTYARQMALEISLLSSLESSLLEKTSKAPLKNILTTSLNNLSPLHTSFDSFTDSNL